MTIGRLLPSESPRPVWQSNTDTRCHDDGCLVVMNSWDRFADEWMPLNLSLEHLNSIGHLIARVKHDAVAFHHAGCDLGFEAVLVAEFDWLQVGA